MSSSDIMNEGCEKCQGIYGIEENDGIVRCPLCGANTIGHARDFEVDREGVKR